MFPISDSISSNRLPIITIGLIAATVFIFFKQITGLNPEVFIQNYALIPFYVNPSNTITLIPFISAIFLHGGFLHIISNMWFLWVFGDDVEARLGFFSFLLLYFGAGIIGNIAQYLLMPTSSLPMLGASGAVAGILGAYYVLFPHSKIKTVVPIFLSLTVIEIPAPLMLGYWFLLQIISGASTLPFSNETGGIAFFAHVGGFLTGVFFIVLFDFRRKSFS